MMQNRLWFGCMALLIAIGAVVGVHMVHARYAIGPTQAGVTDIEVRLSGYSPDAIEVPAGTTVTWTFDDNIAHDVRADAFQSPSFEHGTFTHTFDVAGTYEYHCSFHPIMRGRVVVR